MEIKLNSCLPFSSDAKEKKKKFIKYKKKKKIKKLNVTTRDRFNSD